MTDPFAALRSPVHIAFSREGEIAASMLASGATLLGKAHSWKHGLRNEAFFSLSIGFERLAKLTVVVDYAVKHGGKFPDNSMLKDRYRHDLRLLLQAVADLAPEYPIDAELVTTPDTKIHNGIVEVLCDFAKTTRYYNLNLLTNANTRLASDPISAWHKLVGLPILQKHYKSQQQSRDIEWADFLQATIGGSSIVLYRSEENRLITDLAEASITELQSRVIARYGQFYTLQIIRYLSAILWEVEYTAHRQGLEVIPSLHEYFGVFYNDDSYFKRRKTWSIH